MDCQHRHSFIAVALVAATLVLAGCESASIPIAPSPQATVPVAPPPPAEPVYYTLSGVILDEDHFQVEGVEVYCDSCGSPVGHTFVYSDAQGFYSLSWASNGVHPLLVRKAGFAVREPNGTLPDGTGIKNAVVNGNTRFDILLVRR